MDENIVYGNVSLSKSVVIGSFNILGALHRRLAVDYGEDPSLLPPPDREPRPVSVGERTVICNHTVIYEGVSIGEDSYVDDFVRIGADTRIGARTMLLYGARVYDDVEIGSDCRVTGLVPKGVRIRDNVTIMGNLVHKYRRPLNWLVDEPSPLIEDDVVVGYGAVVVGDVTIGAGSYVAANATVTKAVPPNSMVLGTNEIMPLEEFEFRRKQRGR
jgi:acetyltransferase-like isoleucine patch superfamily enzyme